jgi:ATP-dependent DNA ligase
MELFRVVCERDMEGIVAKLGSAQYTLGETTWVKIKNQHYSQAVGRADFFDRRKRR